MVERWYNKWWIEPGIMTLLGVFLLATFAVMEKTEAFDAVVFAVLLILLGRSERSVEK